MNGTNYRPVHMFFLKFVLICPFKYFKKLFFTFLI